MRYIIKDSKNVKEGKTMIYIGLVGVLMIIGFISVYFGRIYQNNMGYNVGEKYMKDKFAAYEGKNYHE